MNSLEEDIGAIINTLREILSSEKSNSILVKILKFSKSDLCETSYDNWNGGTYGYSLHLFIPVVLYSALSGHVEEYEKKLLSEIKPLLRAYENQFLESILITPTLINAPRTSKHVDKDEKLESTGCWKPGYFRLFLSHVSQQKEKASQLKKAMRKYAVSTFVAHNDIEPTKEWQSEIEIALYTMDALAAILSTEFPESKWCDQEVGIAIGLKKPVIPIRDGINPYGFIGKYQGLTWIGKSAENISNEVFEIFSKDDRTKLKITGALTTKLCQSESYAVSKETVSLLENLKGNITDEMSDKLIEASEKNSQISKAFGVAQKIKSITGYFEP